MDFELDDDCFAVVQLTGSGFPNITGIGDALEVGRAATQLERLADHLRRGAMINISVSDDEIRHLLGG